MNFMKEQSSWGAHKEVPFTFFSLECPVCGQVNEYKKIKSGALVESQIDTDFWPQERIWSLEQYQDFHPYQFLILTCEKCFFTREADSNFLEWKKDEVFRSQILPSLKAKHLRAARSKKELIYRLGTNLDLVRHPQPTLILKLLLAMADEKLKSQPENFKLARYFLMLAWIFREQTRKVESSQRSSSWQILDKKLQTLFQAQRNHAEELQKFKAELENKFLKLKNQKENQPAGEELKDKCLKWIEETQSTFDFLNHWLEKLEQLLSEHNSSKSLPSARLNPWGRKFNNHPNFISFLKSLKSKEPEIPLTEKEALKLALIYYKKSFQELDLLGKEIQKAQTSYLIGELSRRVGDTSSALQYLNFSIRQTQELLGENLNPEYNLALAQKINQLAQQQKNLIQYGSINSP